MSTSSGINRGDRVLYNGKKYYATPNGNSVNLFETDDLSGKPVHRPAATSVTKIDSEAKKKSATKAKAPSKKKKQPAPPSPSESSESESPPSSSESDEAAVVDSDDDSAGNLADSANRFFYVVVDHNASAQEIKIGVTRNCAKRLRSYRTRVPHDHYALVVDTAELCSARALEDEFKKEFGGKRVEQSEVFEISVLDVEKWLTKKKWKRDATSLFIRA